MTARVPTLFVSHGPPTVALDPDPATAAWARSGISVPRAVLCFSAHWETERPALTAAARPETVHDFTGFPAPLYALRYPAPGDPALAARARDLLAEAGIAADLAPDRGLDHGAWVPLRWMFPAADVPVVQCAVPARGGPEAAIAWGRALAPLGQEGVLVLGSGGAVHNLRALAFEADEPVEWAARFDDWIAGRAAAGDTAALLDYRTRAPSAAMAHPREEHLLPLFAALGAAGPGARAEVLYRGFLYGTLSMAAYRFAAPA